MSFQSKYTGQQVEAAIGKAMTAVQPSELKNKQDNITDLDDIRNGASKGATAIQPNDLSKVATSGDYNDLKNTPNIPSPVTEQTVTGWGFTKNKGDYSKPQGGIPKSDLNSDVQDSLNKANSALQEHQSLSGYATEMYVDNAIKQAITITLNTEV